jgi:hypothetical protein
VSDRTETHSDFTWPTADEAQAERARATGEGTPGRDLARATLHHGPWPARQAPFHSSATEQGPPEDRPDAGPHAPLPTSGRSTLPRRLPREHAELRRAALISRAETMAKLVREGREHEARIEAMLWLRVFDGDTE